MKVHRDQLGLKALGDLLDWQVKMALVDKTENLEPKVLLVPQALKVQRDIPERKVLKDQSV